MSVLSDLEPREVFRFFEELCAIPRGSYHTGAVADYLVAFARSRGLDCRRDGANNVVIRKAATAGREGAPVLMLQGHTDMVCEKDEGCGKDMDAEGVDPFVEDDVIGARGTTLGADDGIAVAMCLAILDADDIAHGPLECLFTADEEVGMLGAHALDASDLRAEYLINLDSEEEKVLTVSCAGSARVSCAFPVRRQAFGGETVRVTVDGLAGGHSGEEIHKGRANANILLGRALRAVSVRTQARLAALRGGAKDNAIPRSAEALLAVEDAAAARAAVEALDAALKEEYRAADGGVRVALAPAEAAELPMDADSTRRVSAFLFCAPNGVQLMSADVPGLVQTSLNLGRVSTEADRALFHFMVRSCVNSQRDETAERVAALAEALGGSAEVSARSAAWEYRDDSRLRGIVTEAFRAVYGEEPAVAALHAGLECGVLSGKLPRLDCVSYGPDLTNVHTPRERLHIASTQRVWQLTLETLRRIR